MKSYPCIHFINLKSDDLKFSDAELAEALNQYFKDLRHELFNLELITGYFSVDVNEVKIIEANRT